MFILYTNVCIFASFNHNFLFSSRSPHQVHMLIPYSTAHSMTRPKGKRWKRGEACVSNTTSKKHRLEAANVVRSKRQKTQVVGGPTGLGVALKNLDEGENVMNDDEVTHISGGYNFKFN